MNAQARINALRDASRSARAVQARKHREALQTALHAMQCDAIARFEASGMSHGQAKYETQKMMRAVVN